MIETLNVVFYFPFLLADTLVFEPFSKENQDETDMKEITTIDNN